MRSQRSTGSGDGRVPAYATGTDTVGNRGGTLIDREDRGDCRCAPRFYGTQLVVDAETCPGGGRLVDRPACRRTVIDALAERDAIVIYTRTGDIERAYRREGIGVLLAAGRFVSLCGAHDATLAARARYDPLGAARLAISRGAPVDRIAAETGLAAGAVRFDSYEAAFGYDPTEPSTRFERVGELPDRT